MLFQACGSMDGPIHAQNLLEALHAALQPDQDRRQQAEQFLALSSQRQGCAIGLLMVVREEQVPTGAESVSGPACPPCMYPGLSASGDRCVHGGVPFNAFMRTGDSSSLRPSAQHETRPGSKGVLLDWPWQNV